MHLAVHARPLVQSPFAAHASVFRWQRGDVLLVDNSRVLHDGLPGFGPRRLWVSMMMDSQQCSQPVLDRSE